MNLTSTEYRGSRGILLRRGKTTDGRSLMAHGGDSLYVAAVVDCAWPTFYVVRADSWEDAYDTALNDRTVPACECEAIDPETGECECDAPTYDDDGRRVDSCAVQVWTLETFRTITQPRN